MESTLDFKSRLVRCANASSWRRVDRSLFSSDSRLAAAAMRSDSFRSAKAASSVSFFCIAFSKSARFVSSSSSSSLSLFSAATMSSFSRFSAAATTSSFSFFSVSIAATHSFSLFSADSFQSIACSFINFTSVSNSATRREFASFSPLSACTCFSRLSQRAFASCKTRSISPAACFALADSSSSLRFVSSRAFSCTSITCFSSRAFVSTSVSNSCFKVVSC
mmetsp:Transcript_12165/g.21797  ORF Transcript_12165/g.21797 Transcript_12165/m.21797 type:complete len:221 (-) Transcript_12165:82-744(-)